MTKEELVQKLISKKQAPFLFLGSGFSRHYIKTPDWRGILEMFAPKHINQYFSVLNTDSLAYNCYTYSKRLNDQLLESIRNG